MSLTSEDEERYSRSIVIPEIGRSGQKRLLESSVLVVGAGGLGSPVLYYLAASGVGTLGICEGDRVDLSNLQRQILHGNGDIGRLKAESAADRIRGLNPCLNVRVFDEPLAPDNARGILAGFDVAVDATDNLAVRYLMNDTCVSLGVPLVHGSVHRFDGQASVFAPPRGPCYRCLFPKPPPDDILPTPAEAGVIGPAPGVIGCIEAMEAIKTILGIGGTLVGRLLLFSGLTMEFQELRVERAPDCVVCGELATGTAEG